MANSFVTSTSTETGVVDTVGASNGITVQGGVLIDVAANIASGDTLQLQGEYLTAASGVDTNAKEWLTIEAYTVDTAKVVRIASKRRIRINMSVAAGTSYFELTAGSRAAS